MNYRSLLFILSIGAMFSANAQLREWRLQDVVNQTLVNNLDIQISENNTESAAQLATKGQAGYLPFISLNAAANYGVNNTKLEFAGGIPDTEVNGAVNTSLSTGISLNYVIFNGFGKVNTYQSLMTSKQLSEVQAQVLTENLVLDAINRFLDVQLNQLNLQVAYANLEISRDRVNRTRLGVENGAKSKLDLLQAQVDLNNDSLSVLSLITSIEKQKASLNVLMGAEPETPFFLSSITPIPTDIDIPSRKDKALSNNATILLAQASMQMQEYNRNIVKAQQLPQISMSAGYNIQSSQNGAGIILSQNNNGFSTGINMSIPIFSGGQLTNALKNAERSEENAKIELDKAILNIKNELKAAELDEALIKARIQSQAQNVELASLALERAQLSYNSGQISANDLRIAQMNVAQSKNLLNQANFDLIRLYYSVNRLSGELFMN